MRTLAELSTAMFRHVPRVDGCVACNTCGAIVKQGMTEEHESFHADVAGWLRALRDGKGEV